jgi:hypothetical protein
VIDHDLEEGFDLFEKFSENCAGSRILIISVAMGLLVKSIVTDIPEVTIDDLLENVRKAANMAELKRMTEQ